MARGVVAALFLTPLVLPSSTILVSPGDSVLHYWRLSCLVLLLTPCMWIAVQVLQGREIAGPLQRRQAVPTHLYSKQQLFSRTLGHLSAVYCLLFDRSGRYVITVSVLCPEQSLSECAQNCGNILWTLWVCVFHRIWLLLGSFWLPTVVYCFWGSSVIYDEMTAA